MSVPHSSTPTIEDISIPETVEVAIMKWWNLNGAELIAHNREASEIVLKGVISVVKVALLSLATNPVVPDKDVCLSLAREAESKGLKGQDRSIYGVTEWQRRAFLRRPDPVPEEVKALLWDVPANGIDERHAARAHNESVIIAYKLGKESSHE